MRSFVIPVSLVLIAAPGLAAPGEIPMVAIGLPFAPESPKPVVATHPLYHGMEVSEIEGLPVTVKSSAMNFIASAKRSSVNAAARESFQRMNMLVPEGGKPHVRLDIRWGGSRTPFHIGSSNMATATLHYRLVRIDDGRVLFDRDVTTSVGGGGADASMRDNGIVRAAIGANFASAANCLDHAAFGTAPAECALTPKFSVSVVRMRR